MPVAKTCYVIRVIIVICRSDCRNSPHPGGYDAYGDSLSVGEFPLAVRLGPRTAIRDSADERTGNELAGRLPSRDLGQWLCWRVCRRRCANAVDGRWRSGRRGQSHRASRGGRSHACFHRCACRCRRSSRRRSCSAGAWPGNRSDEHSYCGICTDVGPLVQGLGIGRRCSRWNMAADVAGPTVLAVAASPAIPAAPTRAGR